MFLSLVFIILTIKIRQWFFIEFIVITKLCLTVFSLVIEK